MVHIMTILFRYISVRRLEVKVGLNSCQPGSAHLKLIYSVLHSFSVDTWACPTEGHFADICVGEDKIYDC